MIQTVDCSSKVKLALICVKAFKNFAVDNVPNNLFMTKKLWKVFEECIIEDFELVLIKDIKLL